MSSRPGRDGVLRDRCHPFDANLLLLKCRLIRAPGRQDSQMKKPIHYIAPGLCALLLITTAAVQAASRDGLAGAIDARFDEHARVLAVEDAVPRNAAAEPASRATRSTVAWFPR